ncbi:MAG TPA: hypothetical protein DF296_11850 [Candidatus Margulisbacteria bacterium]|nr:MAG: hypothetical protein A2X42_11430 [Candidatus Margulisbacteria bacterium GWF2_38_17]OGI11240.1 MAG: hypothetical protein A2X41_03855 [Candidatus Margulisbacteria bacterium GWE2_39_32]HCT85875.1 hypothetical protein [Candidatus Margulisiibacteriota bacterium]
MTKKKSGIMNALQYLNPFYHLKIMKVRNKIILSFTFIIICILIVSLFNILMANIVRKNTSSIFFVELPVSKLASDCSKQLFKIRIAMMEILSSKNEFDKAFAQFNAENDRLMRNVEEFNVLLGKEDVKTLQIQNIKMYNDQFRATVLKLLFAFKDRIELEDQLNNEKKEDVRPIYLAKLQNIEILKTEANNKYDLMSRALDKIEIDYQDHVKKKINGIELLQNKFSSISIVVTLISILIGLVMSVIIFSSIINPLQKISLYVKKLSGGLIPIIDISEFNAKDEIGTLAMDFQNMCDGIKFIVTDIKESSKHINIAVKNSIANSEQISTGTCNQSKYLEETSCMVMELSKSIDNISKFINSSYELSKNTLDSAQRGNESVTGTIQEIYDIKTISQLSVAGLERLAEGSKKINNITEIISTIADQTNMLALNAAIEAARAGDQGKGFAVVSDQVAKLADRSARSAKEIEELIENIQKEIDSIMKIGEKSVLKVEEGVRSAEVSGNALKLISTNVDKVYKNIEDINIVSEQQVTLSKKINEAVQNIAATSEETAAGSESSYTQAQSLGVIADKLQDIVKQFEIENA